MSLRYVRHKDIDQEQWDLTIAHAVNPMIYAESWYLNQTTNNQWDALILGDYEAVMPMPFNRKLFGVAQVYRPLFCQQLGIFHRQETVDCAAFVNAIPKRFKRLHYAYNYNNKLENSAIKTNLVLPLNSDYETIMRGFSSSLRKRIKRSAGLILTESQDVDAVIDFYRTHLEDKVKLGEAGYATAKQVFTEALNRSCATVYVLQDGDDKLAMGLFLKKYKRIINVFAASKNTKKHPNSMSVLLAKIIEKHSASEYVFDFEGSDIPGVKKYFESFGSTEQNYPVAHYNRLPFWLKILRPN